MGESHVAVVGVDTGGTFTDLYASDGTVIKVPSTPTDPSTAILDALARLNRPVDVLAHGTTVATNAILERKGARTALFTTAGFEDVLEIRRQNRPSLYDLTARWPDPLVPRERRLGVPERLDFEGEVIGVLDENAVRALAAQLDGVEAVAVTLLFSYANPQHEEWVASLVREVLGGIPISLSSVVAPHYGEYERTSTTVINAYVGPLMERYLSDLRAAARDAGVGRLQVMQSNGGLNPVERAIRLPVTTVLSGPAAGVAGAWEVARAAGCDRTISFDMGGTSTDVAVAPGEILESGDGEVETFPILVPMLTIETVGAGGGSIARIDDAGGLHVGPESAGASPGPAAIGGDRPTVTDANLVLGRLSARGLLGGSMPLNIERARESLAAIALSLGTSIESAAWAVVRLANSNMERAVRAVTLQRGYDPRDFTLVPFGGAGPLHAAEMARGLGIARVLVPPHPGVMAAVGLVLPPLRRDYSRTILAPWPDEARRPREVIDELAGQARRELSAEGSEGFGEPDFQPYVDMRYVGQSFELPVPWSDGADITRDFTCMYEERYGYAQPDEPIEVVTVRLRVTSRRRNPPDIIPPWPLEGPEAAEREVWFGSETDLGVWRHPANILWRPSLPAGTVVSGPAVLEEYDSTTLVPPGWRATIDDRFNIVMTAT